MNLTSKLEMILMEVPKITGTMDPKENISCHEEQCTGPELDALEGFWGWLHKNDLSYGHGNLKLRWKEWKKETLNINRHATLNSMKSR